MNVEAISVGVPTTRFRSFDTIDNSIENEPLFRLDLTNYYNVCRFQRERKSFKDFVRSDVVSLLDILPVMGSLYNLCAITDIYMRFDSCFEDITFYTHLLAAILHCVQFGLLLNQNTKVKCSAFQPLFPVSIIFAMILWDGAPDLPGYMYPLHWLHLLFFVALITFSCQFILTLTVCIILLTCFFIVHWTNQYIQNQQSTTQICTNVIVFLCIISHGFAAYYSLENEYLMNFLENLRFSKYEKIVSEERLVKTRIMKAAFPKCIAEEINRAFDANTIGPFRKMFITKSDNVTIVFADIVGFTSISSFYSAERLVNLLNEIFISFDKIADRYHQLRLKILGDCYYCICGVPEPKTDHAYLSVCMGFGIIDAIRKISAKVSMRVGIHTGSVFSGVIGLSQWQFDVLGQDVKIANLMESSGIAGKVHITHVTRALLSDDYVITPSKAGQRVELLKRVGIRTFFIAPTSNQQDAETMENGNMTDPDNEENQSEISEICATTPEETDWFPVILRFRNTDLENLFRFRRQFLSLQPYSYVFALMIFFGNNFPCSLICWKSTVPVILGLIILLFNIATMVQGMDGLTDKTLVNHLTENILIFISGVVLLFICGDADAWILRSEQTSVVNGTEGLQGNLTSSVSFAVSDYMMLQFLLLTTGVNEGLSVNHGFKCVITVLFVFSFISLLIYLHPNNSYTHTATDMIVPTITVISLSIVIILIERKVETLKRKTFLHRNKTIRNHAKLRKLRKKNKRMLYNIILPDIARDLLDKHDDMYLHSKTHDDVGVMFAACPHFDEFYTENCNYEDGLGCLRFLNEIISDYDEEPEFADLCKIKTIGATYMVASGLRKNLDYISTEESGRCRRREHLGTLMQFALKMMAVIEDISRESFTNFQLRIGINHGPVIAGVIGAHRPHYDIFGNTVNVASRMESTGVIGEIQVLKSTAQTLQRLDYNFKLRGSIDVKGKGKLDTYFLLRTASSATSLNAEPVKEVV